MDIDFLLRRYKDENSCRYERKFLASGLRTSDVEIVVKTNPALFGRIYHKRRVNSIYLDTVDMEYYFANVNGLSQRIKPRIRWYGNVKGHVHNPVLEFKVKDNLVRSKVLYPLRDFTLDEHFSADTIKNIIQESRLPEGIMVHISGLQLSIMTSYEREYFLSADTTFRLTTDSNIEYYRLYPRHNNFLQKTHEPFDSIVVELKYGLVGDDRIADVTRHFPFRLSKKSKYVCGVEKLLGAL